MINTDTHHLIGLRSAILFRIFGFMIAVERAKELIESHVGTMPVKAVKLNDSGGCILAKDIISPVNLPPFDQSAMDGYAILFSDYSEKRSIKIVGEIPAGKDFNKKLSSGSAVRIFTGAPVPKGADAVVMQEKVTVKDGYIFINDDLLKEGSNIRKIGSHVSKGSVALTKKTKITPGGVGYLAAMGISTVKIISKPVITIIVTGSELKKPGTKLSKGQIYESNSYALETALMSVGQNAKYIFRIKDHEQDLVKALGKALKNSDLVLITGGISVGDYDFTGKALAKLKVKNIFYKVKQKPGKPLFFGKGNKSIVFGLPGNPAAVLSCFYEYVNLAIKMMMGFSQPFIHKMKLPLAVDCNKKVGLSVFLKGKIKDGKVFPLDGQESYILSSFAVADCLIYLTEESGNMKEGEVVEVHELPDFG